MSDWPEVEARLRAYVRLAEAVGDGGLGAKVSAALARIEALTPPAGWVLVPRVPTVEMIVDATEQWLCIGAMEDRPEVIWDAMLAAAPAPPFLAPKEPE